jgi:hypothetical protein
MKGSTKRAFDRARPGAATRPNASNRAFRVSPTPGQPVPGRIGKGDPEGPDAWEGFFRSPASAVGAAVFVRVVWREGGFSFPMPRRALGLFEERQGSLPSRPDSTRTNRTANLLARWFLALGRPTRAARVSFCLCLRLSAGGSCTVQRRTPYCPDFLTRGRSLNP